MTPVRRATAALLSEACGVFLRCDRGKALYVTNAPLRMNKEIDWEAAGFHAIRKRGLDFLTPNDGWMDEMYDWAGRQIKESETSKRIARASFGTLEEADRALFIEGIKRLERNGDAEEYDQMVRQRAAVCLREKKGGGALPVCARLLEMMRGG